MNHSVFLLFLLSIGICFSQQKGTITDTRDGKVYKTVLIGTQTWIAENLDVSRFRNGDPIPCAQSNYDWMLADEEKKPACWYGPFSVKEKDKIVTKYKKFYNSFAITDPRGIVPDGWRIKYWKKPDKYLISEKMKIIDIVSQEYWDKTSATN